MAGNGTNDRVVRESVATFVNNDAAERTETVEPRHRLDVGVDVDAAQNIQPVVARPLADADEVPLVEPAPRLRVPPVVEHVPRRDDPNVIIGHQLEPRPETPPEHLPVRQPVAITILVADPRRDEAFRYHATRSRR